MAIAVGAVIVASLSTVVTTYVHLSQRARYLNLANAYVEAKTEELRNNGYNSINLGTTSLNAELPASLPPSKNGSMTVTSPMSGIKQVDISVKYNDQGQVAAQNYTTYIGELGVGQ